MLSDKANRNSFKITHSFKDLNQNLIIIEIVRGYRYVSSMLTRVVYISIEQAHDETEAEFTY